MSAALWIARIAAVVALLCAAAAVATPPGRLPLALRGLQRLDARSALTRILPQGDDPARRHRN